MTTRIFAVILLCLLALSSPASELDQAVDWLESQRHSTGYANPSPQASDALASLRVASALLQIKQGDETLLRAVLEAHAPSPERSTQELVYAWQAREYLGLPVTEWRDTVLARRSRDGGFAKYPGAAAELPATLAVLEQLRAQREQHAEVFSAALGWLMSRQQSDGAWHAGHPLRPSVSLTARSARLLHSLRHQWNVSTALSRADQVIASERQANGLWVDTVDSAAALIYWLKTAPQSPATLTALQAFHEQSLADGSYAGDTYSTAWAVLVLQQASLPPPPADDQSELRGQVFSADTGGALSGVRVSINGPSGPRQLTSNNVGDFLFQELVPGDYSLSLELADHAPFSAELVIPAGRLLDVGRIQLFLGVDAQSFVVRGQVTEAGSDLPIEGATVSAGDVQAITDSNGEYQLLSLQPGEVELLAESIDHYASAATVRGEPGMIVDFSPQLTLGLPEERGSILRGVVIDAETGEELSGININVSGSNVLSMASSSNGSYQAVLPELGEIRVDFEAVGYHPVHWNTTVCRRGLIEVYPRMSPVDGPAADVAGLMGRIVNSANGVPIDGADVQIKAGDESLFTRADGDARFVVSGLNYDTAALTITADGYHPLELNAGLRPYRTRDLGDIGLRPIRMSAYLPDLVIADITLTQTDPDSFDYQHNIEVTVANRGSASTEQGFNVLVFADAADNDQFDPVLDTVLASGRIRGGLTLGEEKTISLELGGQAPFRDAPVKVWIDSGHEVLELEADNNVASTARACRIQPAPLTERGIRERWRWSGWSEDPRVANVIATPLVVQLTDDNGDGVIDQHDIPDIVFVAGDIRSDGNPTQTRLIALSGDDGRELWAVDHDLSHMTHLAAADINKDGYINIVGISKRRTHIVAVNHDGSLLWKTPIDGPPFPVPLIPPWHHAGDYIGITNLEGDSEAQIVYGRRVFRGLDGSLLWEGDRDNGGLYGGYDGNNPPRIGAYLGSMAADINLDGDKQIIAGRTVYDRLGNVMWHRDDLGRQICDSRNNCTWTSGLVAVANLDEDDFAEIVMVIDGTLRALNHDGTDLWGPVDLPDREQGDVAIADLTGDGRPEIVVSQNTIIQVYRYNGDLLWNAHIDDPSGWVSVSIADLNGNGFYEIVHMDEVNFRVLDGATGVEHFRIRNTSITAAEYPVIADVTGDLQANIVLPGNNHSGQPAGTPGIRVFEADNGRWASARGLWNQHHYSINHIDDDGSVPINEMPSWLTHNTFRAAYQGDFPAKLPDITLGRVQLLDDGHSIALEARVGNGGLVSPHDFPALEIFAGDPEQGGELLAFHPIRNLEPGGYVNLRIDDLPLQIDADELHVWVNRVQSQNECRNSNNVAVLPWSAIRPAGAISLSLEQDQLERGDSLAMTATVSNTGRIPAEYGLRFLHLDASGNPIAELGEHPVARLPAGELTEQDQLWQPGGLVEGAHRVGVDLLASDGSWIARAEAEFQLLAQGDDTPSAGLIVRPQRGVYQRDDQLRLELVASNRHSLLQLQQSRVELRILDPQGQLLANMEVPFGTLAGGAESQRQRSLNLRDALVGEYRIEASLYANGSNAPMATANNGFAVEDRLQIAGSVAVGWQNEQPFCLDTVSNWSLSHAQQLPVRSRLMLIEQETEIEARQRLLDIEPGESRSMQRHFGDELEHGDYLCTLEAQQQGQWQVLGSAQFVLDDSGTQPQASVSLWFDGPAEVSEDGTSTTLMVGLSQAPVADVAVDLWHDRPDEVSLAQEQLLFTPGNWNQPQAVTVTGVDDDIRDGDQNVAIHARASSSDPAYEGVDADPVTVINRDNDQPGIEVAPTQLPMLESADQQEQVSVRLLNRPFEPVSLRVRLSDDEHLMVSPTLLQFDADNWDQPQWVTVQARNTLRSEQVTAWLQFGPSASNDMGYHGLTPADIELRVAASQHSEPVMVPLSRWSSFILVILILLAVASLQRSARYA